VIHISFDLDWATGDCRGIKYNCCAWQCPLCGEEPNRAQGKSRPDALKRFAEMRAWLMALDIITPVVVRDCHADILDWIKAGDTVLNWDEHSDDDRWCEDEDSYAYAPLDCGNWVTCAREHRIMVEQMNCAPFPRIDVPVRLFIAVSVPYTLPVCDEVLVEMLGKMGAVDWDLGEK